jgi:hypothetical protein
VCVVSWETDKNISKKNVVPPSSGRSRPRIMTETKEKERKQKIKREWKR